ncbi:MAG: fumarylacetoacetate hydrolase family protein [Actinobacteria bacterium]|nr:fumarylacetoacetate hydrolase family protein [Actinomycetota bacterium]
MRLLTYSSTTAGASTRPSGSHADSGLKVGVAVEGGVVDLATRMADVDDLVQLLADGRLSEAAAATRGAEADESYDDIIFERLVTAPTRILCIGVNYGGRNAEYKDGAADASYPSVFPRFADSFTGHEQALLRPPESPQLDYEGEIVAVIGTAGRRIPVAHARRHLAGLSIGNEGTIRDWVRHAKFNVTQGKNWQCSGALGPWMTTMDEIGDLKDLQVQTRVNGELRQDDTTANMKYSIEYQIHYLSTFTTLLPGDVIFTGTPVGAGARFDPPRWLVPGDVVEVTVDGVGTLRNHIEDEFPDASGDHITAPDPQ